MNVLLFAIMQLIHSILNMYQWVVIIAVVLSYVQLDPTNPIVQTLHRLTEPVFTFVRQKFPFVVFSGIDLSPIAIILGIQFIDTLLVRSMLGM